GLWTGAAGRSGQLALVLGRRGNGTDFSGAPSGSGGMDLVFVGTDGQVSARRQLTDSSSALAPSAAVAGDGEAVVAWRDQGPSTNHRSIWVQHVGPDGTAVPQQLSSDAYSVPAAAADSRGDAAVAWVDGQTRQVLVSFRGPGGVFGS